MPPSISPTVPPVSPRTREGMRASEKPLEFTQENVRAAGEHFARFFDELGEHMIEREDLLAQMELALLARQHVVIVGHPGTAKSAITRGVLDRIVNEEGDNGTFHAQFHGETRRAELLGPKLPQTTAAGETEMRLLIEQGLAPAELAFLDELFDAPPTVLRGALLVALQDRVILDGGKKIPTRLRTAVGASNKTMEQLRAKFGDELNAVFDRFAFVYYTPKRPLREDSAEKIMRADGQRRVRARRGEGQQGYTTPPMTFREMDLLQRVVSHIQSRMVADEWPITLASQLYREFGIAMDHLEGGMGSGGRSKLESQRTQNVILEVLPAIAARRYLKDPETPLAVIPEDLKELEYFMMMRGPVVGDIPSDPDVVGDKADAKFLGRLRAEAEAFDEVYRRVAEPAIRRLQAGTPNNFDPMREKVERLEDALRSNTPMAGDAVQRNWTAMKQIVEDLATSAPRIARGEEVYARAVSVCIRLLARQVTDGGIGVARVSLQAMQPHLARLRMSFFRGPVEEAVEEYKAAVQASYEQKSTNAGGAGLKELLGALGDLAQDVEVLGGEILVETLRNRIKSAALQRALTPETLTEIEAIKDRFVRTLNLHRVVSQEGIEHQIPVDRLIELHTTLLSGVEALVNAVKVAVQGGSIQEAELRKILNQLDEVMDTYVDELKQSALCEPTGEQLPSATLDVYLETKRAEKIAQNPGKTILAQVSPINGDAAVQVEWRYLERTERDLVRVDEQQKFRGHLREGLLRSGETMMTIPEVKGFVDRIVLRAKIAFGATWSPAVEGEIQRTALETLKEMMEMGMDGAFDCPLQPKSITVAPMPIKLATFESAVTRAVGRAAVNDEALREYLQTQGLATTEGNVQTLKQFLNNDTPTGVSGAEKVELETETVETEMVNTSDVVSHVAGSQAAAWAEQGRRIESGVAEIGNAVSLRLVDAHLARLAGGATSPIGTPNGFIAKWQGFLTGQPAGASAVSSWRNIPVDLSGGGRVSGLMEADLTAVLTALVEPENLEEVMTPLDPLLDFVAAATATGNAQQIEALREKGKTRLTVALAKLERALTGQILSAQSSVSARGDRREKIEGYLELMGQSMPMAAALKSTLVERITPIAERLEIASADVENAAQGIEAAAVQALRVIPGKVEHALMELEVAEAGFKMSDLNTLNASNLAAVESFMMTHQLIGKTQRALAEARQSVGSVGALVGEIQGVETRVEALKAAFTTRSAQLRVANI